MSQELRIPAIEFVQRGNRLFVFSMAASQLKKLVKSRPNLSTYTEGVQRLLDPKRLVKIAQYVSEPIFTPMPNNIVINFTGDVRFETTGSNGVGTLIFPADEGYFGDLLDGQHRLYGITNDKSAYRDLQLSVTGIMLDTPKFAGKVFADINRLQVKASPVLIVSIRLAIGDMPDDEESASAIVERLNEDEDSPFHGKIQMHQDEKNCWLTNDKAINIILGMVKPRNEIARVIKHLSIDNALTLMKNYLNAVKSMFPDAWGNNKDYRLTRPAGIQIICNLFDRALKDASTLNSSTGKLPTEGDFLTVLSPIKDAQWEAEYFKENSYTSAGGITRYTDDLLMKFPMR